MLSSDYVLIDIGIWGNFVTSSDPSISAQVANGNLTQNTAANPVSNWPAYSIAEPLQINLNITGGALSSVLLNGVINVTEYVEPGLRNNFAPVNARSWEGGRGARCDFWRNVGSLVPE